MNDSKERLIKIGNITMDNQIVLAPMAGICNC